MQKRNGMTTALTNEQLELYLAIVNEEERVRALSQEEKEDLIIRIFSHPFIDLMCDWAFKHVFGHNEDRLLLLLNDILPEKIVHITFEPNEIDRWKGDDKNVIMDVLCHADDGRKFIVEMQRSDKEYFRSRMLYYGASMLHAQLSAGDTYGKLMPVYVICFMNFRLYHAEDRLIYQYDLRDEGGEAYSPLLNIYLCKLPRLSEKDYAVMTPVEQWFDILQNMRNFVEMPKGLDSRYHPIFEACRSHDLPEKDKQNYLRAMLTDRDREEIANAYLARGREENARTIASNMLKEGFPPELVVKLTGLDKLVVLTLQGK